jgi:hypothetical protein
MGPKVGIVPGTRPAWIEALDWSTDAPTFGPLGCRPCDAANEGKPGQRCTFSIPRAKTRYAKWCARDLLDVRKAALYA